MRKLRESGFDNCSSMIIHRKFIFLHFLLLEAFFLELSILQEDLVYKVMICVPCR